MLSTTNILKSAQTEGLEPSLADKLKKLTTGMSFSTSAGVNKEFVIFASAGVRADGGFVQDAVIPWKLISDTNHAGFFFNKVEGAGVYGQWDALRLWYPKVKRIVYGNVAIDETLARHQILVGPTIAVDKFDAIAGTPVPQGAIKLSGAADGTWGVSPASKLDVTTYATGSDVKLNSALTTFTFAGPLLTGYNPENVSVEYVGVNNYRVRRAMNTTETGNVGATYDLKFILVDNATNADVTSVGLGDVVLIKNLGNVNKNINLRVWKKDNNEFFDSNVAAANFIAMGLFETYLIASPISSTEMLVKWQAIGGITTKVFRATDAAFTTPVEIFSGPNGAGEIVDTGLTANTTYWYKIETDNVYFTEFVSPTKAI